MLTAELMLLLNLFFPGSGWLVGIANRAPVHQHGHSSPAYAHGSGRHISASNKQLEMGASNLHGGNFAASALLISSTIHPWQWQPWVHGSWHVVLTSAAAIHFCQPVKMTLQPLALRIGGIQKWPHHQIYFAPGQNFTGLENDKSRIYCM